MSEVVRFDVEQDRAVDALVDYMRGRFWDGSKLAGPDPGVRLNYRVGRFVKSSLPFIPWNDDLSYMQAQGYWILASWALAGRGDTRAAAIAEQCSDFVIETQRPDGAWDHPNPAWRGRVATVEGTWASIGLLESYRQTGSDRYLEAVLRWHRYLTEEIDFQRQGAQISVNYFANRGTIRVPNNSVTLLRFLAELDAATGDHAFSDLAPGLLAFIGGVQKESGELPYAVDGGSRGDDRPHFQCYQYNAFECLNLMRFHELSGDAGVLDIIRPLVRFLLEGVEEDGHAAYDCDQRWRAVTYHAAAVGAALRRATVLGLGDHTDAQQRCFRYVIAQQEPDGSIPHSRREYRLLDDRRSYPRYLAMMLLHLLRTDLA